jgi:hypothetical protein
MTDPKQRAASPADKEPLLNVLKELGRAFSWGGPEWTPEADVRLASDQVALIQRPGDGGNLAAVLALKVKPGWSEGQYWKGDFRVDLAIPPKGGRPQPNLVIDVSIGGRSTMNQILSGLAQHINERTPYGARVDGEELFLFGPSAIKTKEPARAGVDRLFGDVFVRPGLA